MESKSKAETFIGFAVRAGKFRSGANTLATLKKAYLIIACETAAENTLKAAARYAAKYRCPLFRTCGKALCDLAHKDGIKVAAITDAALAGAIIANPAPYLAEFGGADKTAGKETAEKVNGKSH